MVDGMEILVSGCMNLNGNQALSLPIDAGSRPRAQQR
jgi:hypothetical protein